MLSPLRPKAVSHDWANAASRGAWPLPSPHGLPLRLVSTWVVCGSGSCVGALTLACVVVPGFWVRYAALVTMLNVSPGPPAPGRPSGHRP